MFRKAHTLEMGSIKNWKSMFTALSLVTYEAVMQARGKGRWR
jgi:hypothetical protein